MKAKKTESSKAHRLLRKQIETLRRQKMAAGKVINLHEYRKLQDEETARTILVVDDDEIMRNALQRILTDEGFEVLLASDGLQLSRYLENRRLDLILLDAHLPWVDGYELCRIVKGHPAFAPVPLIIISAHKSEEDVRKGFEAGCDDYVAKPFDVQHLIKKVRSSFRLESA